MQDTNRVKRQSRNIITTWTMGILAFILLPLMPAEAVAQSGSCNSNVSVNISGPAKPWFTADRLTASATFTAWPSSNSTYVDIPNFGYAMGCKTLDEMNPPAPPGEGVTYHNCQGSGHVSQYLSNIVVGAGCVNADNQKILFPAPQSQFIDFRPTNGPMRVAEGTSCTISWDFEVVTVPEGEYDLLQVVSFPLDPDTDPAQCESGISTQQSREVHVMVAEPDPQIRLTKNALPTVYGSVGQKIVYTFDVKNIGNDTLDFTEALTDAQFPNPGDISCTWPDANSELVLLRDETVSCSADYFVTQADLDRGFIYNQAFTEATGRALSQKVEDDDDVTIDALQSPLIEIIKDGALNATDAADGLQAGDKIDYTFKVTNTGNVTLTSVAVTDNVVGTISCTNEANPIADMTPGEVVNCSGSYAVQQADINAGKRDNLATATGSSPGKTNDVTDNDPHSQPLAGRPAIEIIKDGALNATDAADGLQAGDKIDYTFKVTNTGNVTLTSVAVTDNVVGTISCTNEANPIADMTPGEVVNCSGSYAVTQGDINAGKRDNLATATGSSPGKIGDVTDTDPHSQPLTGAPSIEIIKDGALNATDAADGLQAGDKIDYTFKVTNTGNVTLTSVAVTDNVVGTISCAGEANPIADMTPGEVVNCSGSYAVTQGDINAGKKDNLATATGSSPGKTDDVTDNDPHSQPLVGDPSIEIIKDGALNAVDAADGLQAGDRIVYSFKVTNTGNVTLTSVAVTDNVVGTIICFGEANPIADMTPGEVVNCSGPYVITQGDINAGKKDNLATATGSSPGKTDDVTDSDPHSQPLVQEGLITIKKEIWDSANSIWLDANTAGAAPVRYWEAYAIYQLTVENTGNVDLYDVKVSDSLLDITNVTVGGGTLAVGSGPVTLTSTDIPALAPEAPDDEPICSESGDIENVATVNAKTVGTDTPVTANDPAWLTCYGKPDLEILKQVSIDGGSNFVPLTPEDDFKVGPIAAGTPVIYRMTVTNTGKVALVNVSINDPLITPPDYLIGSLAVGATEVVTEVAGQWPGLYFDPAVNPLCEGPATVKNTATAKGTSADDATDDVTAIDDVTVECIGPPKITIEKQVCLADCEVPGNWKDADGVPYPTGLLNATTAMYRIILENTGGVPLTNVLVNDATLGIINYVPMGVGAPGEMAVGEIITITDIQVNNANALVDAAICDSRGPKPNTARVDAESKAGEPTFMDDSATVDCIGVPALQILKEVSSDGSNFSPTSVTGTALADTYWRITVTNIGTAPLTDVMVSDPNLSITPQNIGALTVGQKKVLVPYTPVEADDVDWTSLLAFPGSCTEENGPFTYPNTAIANATSDDGPVTEVQDSATYVCEIQPPELVCDHTQNPKIGERPANLYFDYNGTSNSNNGQGAVGNPDVFDFGPYSEVLILSYYGGGVKQSYILDDNPIVNPPPTGGKIDGALHTPSKKIPPNIEIEVTGMPGGGSIVCNSGGTADDDPCVCNSCVVLQTIKFHGSCSLPLSTGDKYGAITITNWDEP